MTNAITFDQAASGLNLAARAISLESANADTKGLKLLELYNNFTGKIDGVLTGLFDKLPGRDISFSQDRAVAKKLAAGSWEELREMVAYVPPGMHAPYHEYVRQVIATELEWIERSLLGSFIKKLEHFMARAATDVTVLRSSRELASIPAPGHQAIDNEIKVIGNMYKKGDAGTETKLGSVVGNARQWDSVTKDVERYSLQLVRMDRKKIVGSANNIHDYAKLINKRLNELEEVDNLTRKSVGILADLVYQAARAFEFIGVWHAECNEFITAVDHTQKELAEKL